MAFLFLIPLQRAYFWPVLFPSYNLYATVQMFPSWCYYLNSTIKALLSCRYQLDASVLILPSQCHIAESNEMVHKTILYALTFFSKSGKKNQKYGEKNFKMIGRIMVPTIASWCYPPDGTSQFTLPDATVLMLPSQCYQQSTTTSMLPSWHYHCHTTILTLPFWSYHPNAIIHILLLLSQCYHSYSTVLMLPFQS